MESSFHIYIYIIVIRLYLLGDVLVWAIQQRNNIRHYMFVKNMNPQNVIRSTLYACVYIFGFWDGHILVRVRLDGYDRASFVYARPRVHKEIGIYV